MSIFKEKLELAQMEIIEDPSKDYYFHAWVYIATSEESGFFIESTTGERHPLSHSTYKRFQRSVFNSHSKRKKNMKMIQNFF